MRVEFFDCELLKTEYMRLLSESYEDRRGTPFLNVYRSYPRLLASLSAIHLYRQEHARSFAKRLKEDQHDRRGCDAIFAEIIVYSSYLPLVREGILHSIDIRHADYDLKLERSDHTEMYLEIFCLMPDLIPDEKGVIDKRTHTQTADSSVRKKLLRKIDRQGQLSNPRENWAVIELNDSSIAGDFAVLASLSRGYKITFDRRTMQPVSEGYDWSTSVFDEPGTQNLRGIIYFSLGNYEDRKILLSPSFGSSAGSEDEGRESET